MNTHKILRGLALGALAAICLLGILSSLDRSLSGVPRSLPPSAGWGIDACLSCHVPAAEVPGYLQLLQTSDIQWLRERGFPSRKTDAPSNLSLSPATWRAERRAGFRVVAFAGPAWPVPVEMSGNQLPEDLLAVYWAHAETARLTAGQVDAWEMVGEPETFYCKDLPDRVAAYQKAVYLGLKTKGRTAEARRRGGGMGTLKAPTLEDLESETKSASPPSVNHQPPAIAPPFVLAGALAYPPGQWLERAAENGIFDYTDALNIHHYGFARDFGPVIAAHRAMAERWRPGLPAWVTEVGLNNVPYADWEDVAARQRQADYLVSCARQAIDAKVAVFMPFILVDRGDPFAMAPDSEKPLPSWFAYRDFTRGHRLPPTPLTAPPRVPNAVVLQWLPDNRTCLPNKVSGAYEFLSSIGRETPHPIEGEIRAYNFGVAPAHVRLKISDVPDLDRRWLDAAPAGDIRLEPGSCTTWRVAFQPRGRGYLRETVHLYAETIGGPADGARSPLVFGLQTPPSGDFPHDDLAVVVVKLPLGPNGQPKFSYVSDDAPYAVTGGGGEWLGINGVGRAEPGPDGVTFDVGDRHIDPLSPPMAVTATPRGLPGGVARTFLRLRATAESELPAAVRVDLVDVDGERYSIVENLGRDPARPDDNPLYLAYADFHPWVFGRCVPGRERLDPARVREIQLRFFPAVADESEKVVVGVDAVTFLP